MIWPKNKVADLLVNVLVEPELRGYMEFLATLATKSRTVFAGANKLAGYMSGMKRWPLLLRELNRTSQEHWQSAPGAAAQGICISSMVFTIATAAESPSWPSRHRFPALRSGVGIFRKLIPSIFLHSAAAIVSWSLSLSGRPVCSRLPCRVRSHSVVWQ